MFIALQAATSDRYQSTRQKSIIVGTQNLNEQEPVILSKTVLYMWRIGV